ncbi:hypothetical protein LCGC14_0665060 [marine sediment metagenome]|uniref:Uncharacterized protein n=1 Tax=marine sediment metagenome TaxID=412755 RepID=A0A0F9RCK3_9ZZZZ
MISQLDKPNIVCYNVNMVEEILPVVSEEPPAVPDPDGIDLADETGQKALLSRIPHMKGGPRTAESKADYLGYRATGFPIRQACYLANINHSTLTRWRASDPDFADFETNRLSELQASVGGDLVRIEFLRNMRLAMRTDFKVLYKAVHHLDALTEREFKVLQKIRSLYSPQDLLAVTRAVGPNADGPINFADFVLSITRTETEVKLATERTPEDPDIIEAESEEA